LSAIASSTKRDFSFMGSFLLVGIILLIVASLANLFLQIPAFSLALSGVAVLLFSGFILYDTNRIVRGGETNYVMATLSLYISIYQLFTNLLHLLMAFAGNRE
jgi:modulator of FtsH protease